MTLLSQTMTSFNAKDISENLSNRSWTYCSKSCLLLFLADFRSGYTCLTFGLLNSMVSEKRHDCLCIMIIPRAYPFVNLFFRKRLIYRRTH